MAVCLLFICSVSNAQFKCTFSGTVYNSDHAKLENAVVALMKGNTVVQQISTNSSGKFSFNLEPNIEYTLSFTHAGYINKKVVISLTNINDAVSKDFNQPIRSDVEVFQMPKDPALVKQISDILSQPVGRLYFDPVKSEVLNDGSYAASVASALEQLKKLEEEAEKKQEEENAAYKAAIKEGDGLLGKKDYAGAKASYTTASGIRNYEQYPKDKIAECDRLLADAAKAGELDAKYKAALAKADAAFGSKDYKNAKDGYNEALGIKPSEQYPKTQLAKIDALLADAAKAGELEEKYKAAIAKGNAALGAKDYTNARAAYSEALGLKPKEQYPKDQIAEIDKILADLANKDKALKELNEKYANLLAKGDKLFTDKKYSDAKSAYSEASGLKPDEKYPKDKIAECDKMIASDAEFKKLEEAYNAALKKGDKAFDAKNFDESKAGYTEALKLKPNEQYPKDKLAEVDKAIADSQNKKLDEQYNDALKKGDKALSAKDYNGAKAGYNEALKLKPNEQLPKDKLAEVDKANADSQNKKLQEQYEDALKKGDKALSAKDYDGAKAGYNEALKLKPSEQLPKDKLAEVDKAIADLLNKNLQEQYDAVILKADKALSKKDYTTAKADYNEALGLKSNEQYPKDKLAEIEKILNYEMSEKDRLAKEKELKENYDAAITKGDVAFGEKKYAEAESSYKDALGLKPTEKYPKNKIEECEKLLSQEMGEKELLEKYNSAIAKADAAMTAADYNSAKVGYNEALNYKPKEKYPKEKLAEIDKILADLDAKDKANKELNDKYNAAIAKGDDGFTKKDYVNSKANYNIALSLKPNEKYPKDKIAEIDEMLNKEFSAKQLEQNYQAAIAKGDKALAEKDYTTARAGYSDAIGLKPNEKYPKDKLAEVEALIKKDMSEKELNEKYNAAIAKGVASFTAGEYNTAKAAYAEALSLKPSEKYPKDKITECDAKLADEAANKALAEKYNTLIKKADASFNAKDYTSAKAVYTEATGIKPVEQYPKDKIKEIEDIIAKEISDKERNEKYNAAIAKADELFKGKSYDASKAKYNEALNYKPDEKYPKDKIAAIDEILENIEIEKKYQEAIAKADAAYALKNYLKAKDAYTDATNLKPAKKYPIDKLAEINAILDREMKAKQLEENYQSAIAKGNSAFSAKDYETAKASYTEALGLKPNEKYPKDQLAKLEVLLAEQNRIKAINDKYNAALAMGAGAYNSKDYKVAIASYKEAQTLKPLETYPIERIAQAQRMLDDEARLADKEKQYQALIASADKSFASKDYKKAKSIYTDALYLKPKEEYPKKKIDECDQIIRKDSKINFVVPTYSSFPKNELAQKYPEGVTEESDIEKNAKIERRIVVKGTEGHMFIKKTTSFGPVYYFKDGVLISEVEYEKQTK